MTQNKFWLVWNEAGNAPKKPHDTQEKAISEAERLASMYPQHAYIVLEATYHFKANVNVVKTDLSAPENDFVELADSKPDESKFKKYDLVLYKDIVFYIDLFRDGKLGIIPADSFIINFKPIYVNYQDVVKIVPPKTLQEYFNI